MGIVGSTILCLLPIRMFLACRYWLSLVVRTSALCDGCGRDTDEYSPIMSIAEIFPAMVIVKMGMFPRIPTLECESFALHRHPWQGKHEGLTQFEIARGGKKLGE